MLKLTRELWSKQNQHEGDRQRLFTAVARASDVVSVLYPGSYVDVAPSFVWPDVTYVDSDSRAAKFFADEAGVRELIKGHRDDNEEPAVRFLHEENRNELDAETASYDLLISLYAGFISAHCTDYLRVGGSLLVNPSHGDVAMASIDPRYRLSGVVKAADGNYRVERSELDEYLIPKKDQEISVDSLHRTNRGIAYTKSAFAYLFERVGYPEAAATFGRMGNDAINLNEKLATFDDHWSPRTVATFNGHDVMVVKVQGEFSWHSHADTDDFFLVLSGELTIRLHDGDVTLGPGEMYVVPATVEHAPMAEVETTMLLIEPTGTPNSGDDATAAPRVVI